MLGRAEESLGGGELTRQYVKDLDAEDLIGGWISNRISESGKASHPYLLIHMLEHFKSLGKVYNLSPPLSCLI